ncbi:MAG: ATP-dependent RNA helicase HrpA, partial [Halothiobacillaceae bacterium]|nr:ATP-dependent RNA helicase HrpA [Halothiobacillaceae bacterium]
MNFDPNLQATAPLSTQPADIIAFLDAHLPQLPLSDQPALARRLAGLAQAFQQNRLDTAKLADLVTTFEASAALLSERRAAVLTLDYPAELPVSGQREPIMALLRAHQVVIVAGETGSGKTTQLPKMLLELGYGIRGQIGHTQPRRIAARNVASRLAEELGVTGSGVV